MSDFDRDNEWQRGVRDRVLAPAFYGKFAQDGRYVMIDKGRLATVLQKRFAVDTIAQSRSGAAVCVEEKIVRWPGRAYDAFCLETHSCTVPGRESDGWMIYGMADYLLYAFHQSDDSLICYFIDFPALQRWFWLSVGRWPQFGPLDTLNRSAGRLVPIASVMSAVPAWRRHIRAPASEPQGAAA